MTQNVFLLLPVILPLAAAFLVRYAPVKRPVARQGLVIGCLAAPAAAGLAAFAQADSALEWLSITRELTLAFRVDALSRVFLLFVSVIWPLVGLYAVGYLHRDKANGRFFLFYFLTWMALYGLAMARNLVTLYMFYEAMTLLSMPLVLHDRTKEAVAAALKYLIYSVIGASAALLGIFYIASLGHGLEFVPGGFLTAEETPAALGILLAMVIGFGVKAGLFPMHSWLPTAHPVAPAPASAVLSGVITKMGVLGMTRVLFYIAGADRLRGTYVQYALMALSLLTLVMGSTLALKEKVLKKRLAYSSVSQLSYIIFGLSTLTPWGFVGALMHILCHTLIKNTLFMAAGSLIHGTGEIHADGLTGVGRRMPWTLGCFMAASLALVGIPPFCGFVSKWYLAKGAMSLQGTVAWLGPVCLLLSAVLTAGYLLPVGIKGFFPGSAPLPEKVAQAHESAWQMVVPMVVLSALCLLLGLFPGAFVQLFTRIAAAVM